MNPSRNRPTRPPAANETRREAGASDVILLTPAESETFIKALTSDPTPPTPRMAMALELYRETVVEK